MIAVGQNYGTDDSSVRAAPIGSFLEGQGQCTVLWPSVETKADSHVLGNRWLPKGHRNPKGKAKRWQLSAVWSVCADTSEGGGGERGEDCLHPAGRVFPSRALCA